MPWPRCSPIKPPAPTATPTARPLRRSTTRPKVDPSLYFLASSFRPLPSPPRRHWEQQRYAREYAAARERWEQAVAGHLSSRDDDLPPF
jgi:hypothetical protein